MVGTPPSKSKDELRNMEKEELVEYAYDRQRKAYGYWEQSMGSDL